MARVPASLTTVPREPTAMPPTARRRGLPRAADADRRGARLLLHVRIGDPVERPRELQLLRVAQLLRRERGRSGRERGRGERTGQPRDEALEGSALRGPVALVVVRRSERVRAVGVRPADLEVPGGSAVAAAVDPDDRLPGANGVTGLDERRTR